MGAYETDVLIAGGGTAGAFVAWKLASIGHKCTVLEKGALADLGASIGPFHMEESAFERFAIPLPEAPELLHKITDITTWSPMFKRSFTVRFPICCMDKPLFHKRLNSYARDAGAELVEGTEVIGPIIEGGVLRGLRVRGAGGEAEWRARLVVDASGIEGAVRTKMPYSRWFENDPIADEDTIFVYMETWKDAAGDLLPGVNSFPSFIGWCAPGPGDTMIVGVGAGGSPDAARRRHKEMLERIPLKGTPVGSAGGRIPYRRAPLSLVDNALIVVGDAACMNKPFSGEGVTSGFIGCEAAVRAAAGALSTDDLTRDALWCYNTEYFRGQGAKFAFLTAVLPAMMSLDENEMEYLFELPGLMTEAGALSLQKEFEIAAEPAESLRAVPGILAGLAGGKLRPSSLASVGRAAAYGSALKAIYSHYPDSPLGFGSWARRARMLWPGAQRAKRLYFQM